MKDKPPRIDWGCLRIETDFLEASSWEDASDNAPITTQIFTGPPAETVPAWAATVSDVERLVVTLPMRDVLFMITDFPTTVKAELASMVELQSEEVSPYTPERTEVAWEIVKTLENGASRVLMVLASKDRLEAIHDLMLPHGDLPVRADVDVMGWLQLLLQQEQLTSEFQGWILRLTSQEVSLVAWAENSPLLIRSLGSLEELTPEILVEELDQAQINVETAYPQAERTRLQVWYEGEAPDWIRESVSFPEVDLFRLEDLPPLTHGILSRSQKADTLDLTPTRWKEEAQARKARKKILWTGGLIAAGWILCLGGLLLVGRLRAQQVRRIEARIEENIPRVDAIRELNTQVRSIIQFTDRSQGALEILRILAEAAPGIGELQIEELRYRKLGGQVVQGRLGQNVQEFNRFLEQMTASDALVVEDYDLKQSRDGYEFRLEMEWREEAAL